MRDRTAMSPFDGILRTILEEMRRTLKQVSSDDVELLVGEILEATRVFVAGAGRSGLVMRGFAMRLMQLGLHVHVVDDTTTPAIGSGDLLLIGSGSGETDRLVHYAGQTVKSGARLAVATTDAGSPAARLADVVVVIPAPTPKSSKDAVAQGIRSDQPMGTLFEQSLGVMLDASVMLLMARFDETESGMFARHANLE